MGATVLIMGRLLGFIQPFYLSSPQIFIFYAVTIQLFLLYFSQNIYPTSSLSIFLPVITLLLTYLSGFPEQKPKPSILLYISHADIYNQLLLFQLHSYFLVDFPWYIISVPVFILLTPPLMMPLSQILRTPYLSNTPIMPVLLLWYCQWHKWSLWISNRADIIFSCFPVVISGGGGVIT